MKLAQLMSIISASTKKDWHHIGGGPSYRDGLQSDDLDDEPRLVSVRSHSDVAVYLEDVSITLAYGMTWRENFQEEWTDRFPDKKAWGCYADVFYQGSLVYRVEYVNVDGGLTNLPLPSDRYKLEVPRAYALFVRLIDSFSGVSSFDQYFQEARMKLVEEAWPVFGEESEDGEERREQIH